MEMGPLNPSKCLPVDKTRRPSSRRVFFSPGTHSSPGTKRISLLLLEIILIVRCIQPLYYLWILVMMHRRMYITDIILFLSRIQWDAIYFAQQIAIVNLRDLNIQILLFLPT